MKKWLKWILIVLGIFLVIDIGAGMYFFHVAEVRSPKTFLNNGKQTKQNKIITQQTAWYKKTPKENWVMKSAKGNLKLDANYIPAAKQSDKTVVLSHGFMQNKDQDGALAGVFHQMGYNVLMPDDQGHGDSQGKYIGYGWLDKDDYLKWINLLLKKKGANQQIVMWGISMGGATTMMVSGMNNLPHQVKAFVEDCGYTSVEDEITYQAKSMYNLPKWPLVPTVSLISQLRAGYNYSEASSIKQVAKNKRPMLFIHGGKDTFVPTKMVYQVYKADRGPKQLAIFKGAAHAKSFESNPVRYEKLLKQFLGKYVN